MSRISSRLLMGFLFVSMTVAAVQAEELNRELLSEHETIAKFEGLQTRVCRGRTSACPNRCEHSGKMATFKIVKYTKYSKPGKYGDPKRDVFSVLLSSIKNQPEMIKTIEGLTAGDKVILNWRHDYVTRGRSKSPERPITKLEKITGDAEDGMQEKKQKTKHSVVKFAKRNT
jgi:hypothetical protein